MSWHLAQVNIARSKAPLNAPEMAGLTSRIAETNALAESSPGFLWRFTAESDANNRLEILSDYFVPFDRDCFVFNLSVWRSVDDLKRYAFDTAHLELFRRRHEWMDPFPSAHAAMWWIRAGRTPAVAEARVRLPSVDQNGPTEFAFTFAKPFPPSEAAAART
jgi:hypothetical protein